MDKVRVKSKVGNFHIRRRTQILNCDGALERYDVLPYEFSGDYITELPQDVWEGLHDEFLDRTIGLRYRDALRTI